MAELRIRTTRHTIRVSAPPKQVYQLIANVDSWPRMFDSMLAVEHIGYDGTLERVRFWGTFADRHGSWVSSHDLNPKRLQVRFRWERAASPFASFGGLWLVSPKGSGSFVALDHYYRVVDDDPIQARRMEEAVGRSSDTMLASLRAAAEFGLAEDMRYPVGHGMDGVRLS